MLWRNQILHAVAPNLSDTTRLHIYFSYQPRCTPQRPLVRSLKLVIDQLSRAGMRQTNVMDMYVADPELLDRSSPIRRQLLGAMGDNSPPMPSPGASKHWAADWDQIPLREWAERHARAGEPFDCALQLSAHVSMNVS